MLSVLHILQVLLPLSYVAAFGLYLQQFLQKRDSGARPPGPTVLGVTLGAHVLYLVARGVTLHHFPVASRAEFLSLVALCVGLVYALAEIRHKESHTGIFFIGIVAVFQMASSLLVNDADPHSLLHANPIYGTHVVFTVFGFAALAVSALYALMYILLARQLKSRKLGVIFRRLPPLLSLEQMSRLAAVSGIVLLGLGIALGHAVAFYVLPEFNIFDPKILITDAVWLAYLVGYIVARLRGLSGLRMGYLSLAGYLAFILSMILVNTFASTFHQFS